MRLSSFPLPPSPDLPQRRLSDAPLDSPLLSLWSNCKSCTLSDPPPAGHLRSLFVRLRIKRSCRSRRGLRLFCVVDSSQLVLFRCLEIQPDFSVCSLTLTFQENM